MHILPVASGKGGVGKSLFSANLAVALGQAGKRVVLVDLDLRKPKMNRVFNTTNRLGLNDYLSGKIKYEEMVRHSDEMGFDYILTGEKTSSVAKVLESDKLKALIAKLRENYDYVLLDTPPVIAVSDAMYIAKITDGVIFVISQDHSKKQMVREAISTLRNNHAEILGIVLTQVDMKGKRYGYGYDYNYVYE